MLLVTHSKKPECYLVLFAPLSAFGSPTSDIYMIPDTLARHCAMPSIDTPFESAFLMGYLPLRSEGFVFVVLLRQDNSVEESTTLLVDWTGSSIWRTTC